MIGIFYIATIRPGQSWGDDFATYIHHAKNIVEGKQYSDVRHVYSEYTQYIAPSNYPPGLPLMLVPIYGYFGFNLNIMKVFMYQLNRAGQVG